METINSAMTNGQTNGGVVSGVVGPTAVGVVSGGTSVGQGKFFNIIIQ